MHLSRIAESSPQKNVTSKMEYLAPIRVGRPGCPNDPRPAVRNPQDIDAVNGLSAFFPTTVDFVKKLLENCPELAKKQINPTKYIEMDILMV